MSRAKNHFFLKSRQHQISDRFLFACHVLSVVTIVLGDVVRNRRTGCGVNRLWLGLDISTE